MLGEGDWTALSALKGEVEGMGVLSSDEGLRQGDLEALRELWGKLLSLGERAKKNGWVTLWPSPVDRPGSLCLDVGWH